MTELYLLRHGMAVDAGTCGYDDRERPLTAEGEKKVRQLARGLRALDLGLDRIVTSPLLRARQTAEIVAGILELSDQLELAEELASDRSAESIRDWLRTRNENRLMIVGHNPNLSELTTLLVVGTKDRLIGELRKGGIAALVSEGSRWRLDWMARPRLLRLKAE